ncbi:serine/threonine-protein phosphatase [Streptomyces alfalfae]|uniref:Serine/threonine-protein phosphatase n=1 Tax=Streptomyces alfalfae TaxID=1642299 RepID=A0A1P8TSY5_9ACTN|nr:PP2C family protein-serine/threonine phosphatase [Streptomyces alfalfae]AYA16274.1 serine/threonine-protein phosphatase [Streptomyces fradiae]APY90739.1 serine/threonine protein phosphatase [Streptomyces alfalfae]QQC94022.1 serine/threonine-protein phosphatase [Streptomyces alfalfae]QUI36116.1 serine/threonine-protein phosphatase [Streptomyces alfalfae]RXX38259.1 serine/threonine-protein phosphatase [Streptomyces alfalfae]
MSLAGVLAAAEAAAPVESLDVVARMLSEHLGAVSVSFLITDFTGGSVVRLGAAGSVETDEPARRITLRGTLYDDVIRTQQPRVEDTGENGRVRVVAPVTNRGDAMGLLELFLPAAPSVEVMREIGESAHALAYIVIANRSFTDVYQWGRRTTPLSLAAEIQHRLLPASLACEAAQFAVAGALEPADHVGGDTFDYTIDRDAVQLSVTDAMGHDVGAALLATLVVGALRRARRAGADLAEQARQADRAMREHSQSYVTGQMLRISLVDGGTEFINAGHPWPLVVRDGKVREITPQIDLPFGFQVPHTYRVQALNLRPGDRLVMLTDGMLERRAGSVDLRALIVRTRALHPREATRTLVAAVVDANQGHLEDDATVMCLDWQGVDKTGRDADTGADLTDASSPSWARRTAPGG